VGSFLPGQRVLAGFQPHLDLCERYCAERFSSSDDRKECIKDAKRERGPCYEKGGPGLVVCDGRCCRPSDCVVVNGTRLVCVVNSTAIRV
jgi:hypothetical protein